MSNSFSREEFPQSAPFSPRNSDPMIMVVGAGAAGMAAAISAAAHSDANIALVESEHELGGTVANALIHTIAGIYDDRGEVINDGLVRELLTRLQHKNNNAVRRQMGKTWVLSVCPEHYRRVVHAWINSIPQIALLTSSSLSSIKLNSHKFVTEVAINSGHENTVVHPRAVVDATGFASVVRSIDAELVEDDLLAAGGFVIRLRPIDPQCLIFPQSVGIVRSIRQAVLDGVLPRQCDKAWIDQGIHDDEMFVKLFVPLKAKDLSTRPLELLKSQLESACQPLVRFLNRQPGLEQANITSMGSIGVRDGGRVKGNYTLTREDVLSGRKFDDAACRCCWPIEYWDPVDGVNLDFLPAGTQYDIPKRSLAVSGLNNVFVAGKCLSADRFAQASARVAGCCWAMGDAAGKMAAQIPDNMQQFESTDSIRHTTNPNHEC